MISGGVGIIGVGAMGGAVARRLLKLGYRVHVRDIRPEAETPLAALGARTEASPGHMASQCQTLIVLVVDAQQIEEVMFGPQGAAATLTPGSVVLLSSTISPGDAADFAERLGRLAVHVLDAPISGGPARAEAGTMSMMLAASPQAQSAAEEILPILSDKIFRVSARPGDGARFKLLNNILAGINLVAGAEVLALGLKMGLEGERLLEVIGNSSGASWVMQDRMTRALGGDWSVKAATRILAKDVSLFMELAREENFPAFMGTQAVQLFQAALANGFADEDDAALLKLYQRLA